MLRIRVPRVPAPPPTSPPVTMGGMEIGSTLRETRIRAGISVEEIEARTKIRAKYLRALENEE